MVGHRRIAGLRAALAAAVVVAVAALARRRGASCTRRDAAVRELRRRCRGRLEPIWRQLGCRHRRLARLPPVGHQRGRQGASAPRRGPTTPCRPGSSRPASTAGPARRGGGAGAEHHQLLRVALTNTGRQESIKGKRVAGHARRRRRSVVTGSWYTLRLEVSGSTLTGWSTAHRSCRPPTARSPPAGPGWPPTTRAPRSTTSS